MSSILMSKCYQTDTDTINSKSKLLIKIMHQSNKSREGGEKKEEKRKQKSVKLLSKSGKIGRKIQNTPISTHNEDTL